MFFQFIIIISRLCDSFFLFLQCEQSTVCEIMAATSNIFRKKKRLDICYKSFLLVGVFEYNDALIEDGNTNKLVKIRCDRKMDYE